MATIKSLFGKPDTTAALQPQDKALTTVEVKDIKQYLVDEYERARAREREIERLNDRLEEAREVKMQYDAALVTMNEFERRLGDADKKIQKAESRATKLREQLEQTTDELNTHKIKLNRAALDREAIIEEFIEDVKSWLTQQIVDYRGNLSKAAVHEIIKTLTPRSLRKEEGEQNDR